jgi:hypothetical protein
MSMAEENVLRLQQEPVSRSEFTGMVQTLQAQMDQQTANFQSQMSHLKEMMAKHFGSGGGSKSPVHQYNFQHQQFSGGKNFFPGGTSSGEGILKPKTVCLDFPSFDGEDAETWCCRTEQFFEYYITPDEHRLPVSSFHMDGRALVWFRELYASNSIHSWREFVHTLQIHFGQGSYDDPMETLSKLKQDGTLEEYKNQFDTLALKVCYTYRNFTNSAIFWEASKTRSGCP